MMPKDLLAEELVMEGSNCSINIHPITELSFRMARYVVNYRSVESSSDGASTLSTSTMTPVASSYNGSLEEVRILFKQSQTLKGG